MHPLNALAPMLVTLFPMFNFVTFLFPFIALEAIAVTLYLVPLIVTYDGMVIVFDFDAVFTNVTVFLKV